MAVLFLNNFDYEGLEIHNWPYSICLNWFCWKLYIFILWIISRQSRFKLKHKTGQVKDIKQDEAIHLESIFSIFEIMTYFNSKDV